MSIFVEFLSYLKPIRNHYLPQSTGKSLYGFLLGTIRRIDPALSKIIHDYSGPKPFTVSRLIGSFERRDGQIIIDSEKKYCVRFTSMSDIISKAIIEALSPTFAKGDSVYLWGEEFELLSFEVSSLYGYPSITSLEILIQASERIADKTDSAIINFVSETLFRYKDRNILFPSPEVLFNSAWKRLTSITQIDLEKPFWSEKLNISKYHLRTSVVNFEKIPLQGFKGKVEYDASRLNLNEKKQMLTLCLALNYIGLGAKTTIGMGQTYLQLNEESKEALIR